MSDRAKNILRPFEENRAYMEERISAGIEANRKGFVTLRFENEQGLPVTDVHVEMHQKSHDFRFGANLFLLDEMETEEKNKAYRERFKELFNLGTIPFYWKDLEPEQGKLRFDKDSPRVYRRPAPDLCVEFCEQNGIEPKLHCLNYDQFTPMWVPSDVPTVKKYLDKRFAEIAERYADKIPSMEVINETLCSEVRKNDTSRHSTLFFREPDVVEWSFEHARRYLPSNRLIINEAIVWGDAFKYNRSAYYMQIERALAKGASIDSIGMQYHMFCPAEKEQECTRMNYNPRILYGVMDQYADFGKPLQVTEVTIPAYSRNIEDEELQAEIIKNLYSIWFSHSNMEAIIYWNLVDGYAYGATQGDMAQGENYFHGALLHFDMMPKPAFRTLKKLIHETWKTNLSVDSGEASSVNLKGFYGEYDITVTAGGRTVKKAFHLEKGLDNSLVIKI